MLWLVPDYNNTIIIITITMFMVLSSWHSHCESSPSSFDECRLSAGWPPTLTALITIILFGDKAPKVLTTCVSCVQKPGPKRGISCGCSVAWNSLPPQNRAASSLLTFRRETKSHLFRQSFGWWKS